MEPYSLFSPNPGSVPLDVSERARRPELVSAAAAVLGVESVMVILLGLQNNLMMKWHPPYDNVVYVLFALGAAAAALALRVARVDPPLQKLAVGGAAFLLLSVTGWTIFSFASGVFSILSVLTILGAICSIVLLVGSLQVCAVSYAAREQLRSEGIEFNL